MQMHVRKYPQVERVCGGAEGGDQGERVQDRGAEKSSSQEDIRYPHKNLSLRNTCRNPTGHRLQSGGELIQP